MKAIFLGVLKLAAAMLVGLVAFIAIALGGLEALSDDPDQQAGAITDHEELIWPSRRSAQRKDNAPRPATHTSKRAGECTDPSGDSPAQ